MDPIKSKPFALAGMIIVKIWGAAVVMGGVTVTTFVLMLISPGDPAYLILIADGNLEPSRQEIMEMRETLGLNRPVHTQYLAWLGRAVRGDMGRSFVNGNRIDREMLMRIPYTLKLALASALFSTLLGIALGLFMASNHNRLTDRAGQLISIGLISVPNFWIAILLIGIFSETLRLLPTSGVGSWAHYVLPALVLAAGSAGSLSRLARTVLLNELSRDHITTARSKGITESALVLNHALPNAMIPITTSLGLQFGHILGGAVIVESIFSIPGIGQYAMTGILNRDYPVIQGFVLYTAALFITINFLLDIAYLIINPELRRKGRFG